MTHRNSFTRVILRTLRFLSLWESVHAINYLISVFKRFCIKKSICLFTCMYYVYLNFQILMLLVTLISVTFCWNNETEFFSAFFTPPFHPSHCMAFYCSLMSLLLTQMHLLSVRFITLYRSFQKCRITSGMHNNVITFSDIKLSEGSVLLFNKHSRGLCFKST